MPWSIFSDGGGQEVAKGWAIQLLQRIGAPTSAENVQFVYDWEVSEGGGGKYNPLNQGPDPGKPYLTTTGSQYGGGAADYASWDAGLQGAQDYLGMPAYSGITDALRRNDAVTARASLISSGWAASHYGDGAAFSDAAVPGGKAVMPPAGTGPATQSQGGGDPSCVVSWPKIGFLGGGCILSKTNLRALAAGGILLGGALIGIVGVLMLTGVTGKAAQVLTAVPGVTPAGRAISAAAGARWAARKQSSDDSDGDMAPAMESP